MNGSKTMLRLHQENFKAPIEIVSQILLDNGVVTDQQLPSWFSDMLTAASDEKDLAMVYHTNNLDFEEALLDLNDEADWNVVDVGESMTVSFPVSGFSIWLSREHSEGIFVTWLRLKD